MTNRVLMAFDRCYVSYQASTVHSTDGTLGIAKAVVNDNCYLPSLLDLEELKQFLTYVQAFFFFQLLPLSSVDVYCMCCISVIFFFNYIVVV